MMDNTDWREQYCEASALAADLEAENAALRAKLEETVFLALGSDAPAISISKGRELLGFEYMEDMREWLINYRAALAEIKEEL